MLLRDAANEDQILERAFAFFDKDGNGEISVSELRCAPKQLLLQSPVFECMRALVHDIKLPDEFMVPSIILGFWLFLELYQLRLYVGTQGPSASHVV